MLRQSPLRTSDCLILPFTKTWSRVMPSRFNHDSMHILRVTYPPRVQRFVTLLPIKMHSVLKNWIKPIEIQCSLMLSLDPFSI